MFIYSFLNNFLFLVEIKQWQNCIFNILLWIISLICTCRMFVYAEPIIIPKTKTSHEYWKHKRQSEAYFEIVRLKKIN